MTTAEHLAAGHAGTTGGGIKQEPVRLVLRKRTVSLRVELCACGYWPLNAAHRAHCPNCGHHDAAPGVLLLDRDGKVEQHPGAWTARKRTAVLTATFEART